MIADIEADKIFCVIVKDLSRLGRNMAKVSTFVQEYFPSKKIHFIAIDDNIDKSFYDIDTSKDMIIDVKNMFNGFYPKDISKKVRSTFRAKQHEGQFIGAFPSYGYAKSLTNHNQLVIDPCAAQVVRRIYHLYIEGLGQNTIAKQLNKEGIPCPSEYKKQCGLNYHNSKRLDQTSYWTYSSIRNILRNKIYTGTMVQNRSFRQICSKNAISLPQKEWITVPHTHEAIIDTETFEKVQNLLKRNTRQTNLQNSVHIFAGYIRCGDCGRAMVKRTRHDKTFFCCGSYQRYGTSHCSPHYIDQDFLENIILNELNSLLASCQDLHHMILTGQKTLSKISEKQKPNIINLQNLITKIQHKKEKAYDDYNEELLSKSEYTSYKKKCEEQINSLTQQIHALSDISSVHDDTLRNNQINALLKNHSINQLKREFVVEMVDQIYIYANNTIKIVYNY